MLVLNDLPPMAIQGSLFTQISDSKFSDSIRLGLEVLGRNPQVLDMIHADQIKHGLDKKRLREADARWERQQSASEMSPLFDDDQGDVCVANALHNTKPRMSAEVVFIFVLVRAYLGNIKSEKNKTFIYDSKFLQVLLQQYGYMRVPGASTILDNINLLSDTTIDEILRISVKAAVEQEEVSMKKLYFDSTRIQADSAWPTESKTILDLLNRVRHGFQILREQGIAVNLDSGVEEMLEVIQSATKSIALTTGKKGAKKNRKKKYQQIFREAKKLIQIFEKARKRIEGKLDDVKPSLREWADCICEWMDVDLSNASLCVENAKKRILKEEKVPAESKVTGISDPDAAMIAKGEKQLVFGYKPQVGRSEQGFIVSVIIPIGAASDQSMGVPIVEQAIDNIGSTPSAVSFDDGYTDQKTRSRLNALGIATVSFSGARAKAVLPEEEYESPVFQKLRNERSRVESTMAQLKRDFGLDRFTRRGISAVTQELKSAAAYHNFSLLSKILRNKELKKSA